MHSKLLTLVGIICSAILLNASGVTWDGSVIDPSTRDGVGSFRREFNHEVSQFGRTYDLVIRRAKRGDDHGAETGFDPGSRTVHRRTALPGCGSAIVAVRRKLTGPYRTVRQCS